MNARSCAIACVLLLAGCALPVKQAAPPPAPAPTPAPSAAVLAGEGSAAEIERHRQQLADSPLGLAAEDVGYYMDVQFARFKQLGEAQLEIARQGDGIRLRLPGALGFDVGSATLSESGRASLKRLAAVLQEYRSTQVSVHGHTDDSGPPAVNQRLSEQRALAIARYLQAQGVSPARLLAIGHGAGRPLVANADEPGRERNRRVELEVRPLVR